MKKKKSVLPTKVGAARQYMMDTYSPIPGQDLKMGNVFLLLVEQEKSVARTIRAVSEIFSCSIRPNDMKTVLNNLNSLKRLGREKEMEDFIQRCSEPFTMFTAICET